MSETPLSDIFERHSTDRTSCLPILVDIQAEYKYLPRQALEECVERVVELFHPRLVLGISDELPEAGGEETFERMRWVAEWCRSDRGRLASIE